MPKRKSNKIKLIIGIFILLAITSFLSFIAVIKNKPHINSSESHIPIAMALDDGYLYPTIVAISSIMSNSGNSTIYDFYIMHPSEFSQDSKIKLKSLEKKYNQCHIQLIDMGDEYRNANDNGHITTPAYYRLSLSKLLPNLDKILWIDGDTLTFHDLREMYDIDMQGYYYKGFLDDNTSAVDSFGIYNDHCICDGVMIINLKELRTDNVVEKFKKFIEENNEKLIQHDQTTINVVCYLKIGILPPKFGIYSYDNAKQAGAQAAIYRCSYGYSSSELESAYKDPVILHCIRKPWKSMDAPFSSIWWEYAQKTDYFEQICEKYPIFKK